jgi:hypothetical protein
MYINFLKKVAFPIFVVIPIQYQYVLFIFCMVVYLIETYFDCRNQVYSSLNRLAVYKLFEGLSIVILIVYFGIERSNVSYAASEATSIAVTFVLSLFTVNFIT